MSVHIIVLVGLGHCQGVYIRRVWLVYFIVLFMGCLSTSLGHCKGVHIRRVGWSMCWSKGAGWAANGRPGRSGRQSKGSWASIPIRSYPSNSSTIGTPLMLSRHWKLQLWLWGDLKHPVLTSGRTLGKNIQIQSTCDRYARLINIKPAPLQICLIVL